MADIRIKDLATTATTTASDDFMAVDGVTNGTRKLSAATPAFLTSVTTPSLTSPAASPLTLGTGTSGAAITVLSASNNVGIGTTSPAKKFEVSTTDATQIRIGYGSASALYTYDIGRSNSTGYLNFTANEGTNDYGFLFNNGKVGIGTTSPSQLLELSKDSGYQQVLSEYSSNTSRADLVFRKARGTAASPSTTAVNDYLGIIDFSGYGSSSFTIGAELLSQVEAVGSSNYSNFIFSTREQSNNTVTERMRIANNGTVSISSTTAGASNAGALVVAGGLSAAGASYFGGAMTFASTSTAGFGGNIQAGPNAVFTTASGIAVFRSPAEAYIDSGSVNSIYLRPGLTTALTLAPTTLAATFAGAVSAQGNVAVTNTNLTGAALSARYNASNQRIGFNIQNSNGPASLAWNAASTTSSDTLNYDITQAAGKIGLNSATGAMTLSVAASGTAGNAITFTDAVSITPTTATFAGAVAIGNTVNTVSPTSPNRTVTMVVNGVTLYLAAKTTND